jgi:hypothetical protein
VCRGWGRCRGSRLRDDRRRGLRSRDRRRCDWSRTLLHCAWACRISRYEEKVDYQYKEHQNCGQIDSSLNEKICCAAYAEDRANAARGCQAACKALALCGLSEYDKSEEGRYEDRENYCNRIHFEAKTLVIQRPEQLNFRCFASI